jgi:hypothetical protein
MKSLAVTASVALFAVICSCKSSTAPSQSIIVNVISGSGQTIAVRDTAPEPLVVRVVDGSGAPVESATVAFSSKLIAGFTLPTLTDANGMTQTRFVASTAVGLDSITTTTANVTTKGIFIITIVPGPADTVRKLSGDGQVGSPGQVLLFPFVVAVRDTFNNNIQGVTVNWVADGGIVSAASTSTDSVGQTQISFTLPDAPAKVHIAARVPGIPDAVFIATAK